MTDDEKQTLVQSYLAPVLKRKLDHIKADTGIMNTSDMIRYLIKGYKLEATK